MSPPIFPSIDSFTLFIDYKSPAIFAGFGVEPIFLPIAIVLTAIAIVLNKVFLIILASVRIIFSLTGHIFPFPLGIQAGVEWLGHIVILYLTFRLAVSFYIPLAMHERSNFSTSLPTQVIVL